MTDLTDLTDEAVKALLDAEPDVWTWRSCENSQGWNTKFGDVPPKPGPYIEDIVPLYGAPVPDLARALLDARAECDGAHMIIATERAEVVRLRAENARLRADAQAAAALALEKAAEAVPQGWCAETTKHKEMDVDLGLAIQAAIRAKAAAIRKGETT